MADQVKLRLSGLPDDVEKVSLALKAMMLVLEESENYANRGNSQFVRRYLVVKPEPPLGSE